MRHCGNSRFHTSDAKFHFQEAFGFSCIFVCELLQCFPAFGMIGRFEHWHFGGQAGQNRFLDDHRTNLAGTHFTRHFTGQCNQIDRLSPRKAHVAFHHAQGKLLRQVVENRVQIKPRVVHGEWQHRVLGCRLSRCRLNGI